MRCCGIQLIAISQKILKIFIVEMSLKFINLRLQSNPQGANEPNAFPWNVYILIKISGKFVPRSPTDHQSALVTWCWKVDKPLPEPMVTSLKSVSNYISEISFIFPRGQWVNQQYTDTTMHLTVITYKPDIFHSSVPLQTLLWHQFTIYSLWQSWQFIKS